MRICLETKYNTLNPRFDATGAKTCFSRIRFAYIKCKRLIRRIPSMTNSMNKEHHHIERNVSAFEVRDSYVQITF